MTREPGAASKRTDPAFYEALGRAIKVARTQQDLSRKALAARANVSYAYLSDIETGRGRPSSRSLFQIAEALGRTPSELLQEAELYGELQGLGEARNRTLPSAVPPPEAEPPRWFHDDAPIRGLSDDVAPASPAVVERHRWSTRDQLQRLARARLEGGTLTAREELHAAIEQLSDDDVQLALTLLRRLRPSGAP